MHETRFLQFNLRLSVSYRFAFGQPVIEVVDTVRNASDSPTTMQMLYHVNVGAPLLEAARRCTVLRSALWLAINMPLTIWGWSTYLPPTPGYVEQVYFSSPTAAADGWATTLLASKNRVSARLLCTTKPTRCLISRSGRIQSAQRWIRYGLEPGTGFPNPRSFEEKQGRVVRFSCGQSIEFNLRLEGTSSRRSRNSTDRRGRQTARR